MGFSSGGRGGHGGYGGQPKKDYPGSHLDYNQDEEYFKITGKYLPPGPDCTAGTDDLIRAEIAKHKKEVAGTQFMKLKNATNQVLEVKDADGKSITI